MPDEPLRRLVDDKLSVSDEDVIFRRIGWNFFPTTVRDRMTQGSIAVLSSNCFRYQKLSVAQGFGFDGRCMSVASLAALVANAQVPADLCTGRWSGYGLVRFSAAALRSLASAAGAAIAQGIMFAPTPDEVAHSVIFPMSGAPSNALVDVIAEALRDLAIWEIPLLA